jgi:hypothetical protein
MPLVAFMREIGFCRNVVAPPCTIVIAFTRCPPGEGTTTIVMYCPAVNVCAADVKSTSCVPEVVMVMAALPGEISAEAVTLPAPAPMIAAGSVEMSPLPM